MPRFQHGVFCLLSVALLCGCGSKGGSIAPARVSGKVMYKNAVVSAGFITFHPEDDKGPSYPCSISADGTFELSDVAAGKMVVTVETESANPAKKAQDYGGKKGMEGYAERMAAEKQAGTQIAGKGASGAYVKVPEKYGKRKTSPLIVTLEAGRQVREFELTD